MQIYSIGRDIRNQIVLDDASVSRQHAEITFLDDGKITLKDVGSSNGTFVNGSKVMSCLLQSGDIVKCASTIVNWQQLMPSTGYVSQNSGYPYQNQPAIPTTSSVSPSFISNNPVTPPNQFRQNVVVVGKAKSVGVALLLAFFFGPLGLLYSTVTGGIMMFFLYFFIGALSVFFPPLLIFLLFMNFGCVIWAVIAANAANKSLQNQAGNMIISQR